MPAIPSRDKDTEKNHDSPESKETPDSNQNSAEDVPIPLCRLELRDVSTEGSKRFLAFVDASSAIQDAVRTVHKILSPHQEGTPNVRSITLILRDFEGVAYTCGKDIDFEHKEIHFSTNYIAGIKPELLSKEITGVLVHEMVHVWQWNGQHTCNGGLIEGVADWVRLKAELGPPHWRQRCEDCEWDSGYEVTAYFLEWLEERFGKWTIIKLNQKLRKEYHEEQFWPDMFDGKSVKSLWEQYALQIPGVKEEKKTGESFQVNGDETDNGREEEALKVAPAPLAS